MDKVATKQDWKVLDMPKKKVSFSMKHDLTAEEFEVLKRGHIPHEMEDKWFSYFENGKLYIHRSWSGVCIYIVEFFGDEIAVTVNRDKKQYRCKDIEEDKSNLLGLMHGALQ